MLNSKLNLALAAALCFAGISTALAQKESPLVTQTEDQLIAVLKSDAAQKEKADACLQLGVIGTKKAVATLAALLPDETMNHMARYGLEPIQDASVDEAFRAALSTAKGRPLVGVIGSIGVRKDAKAVDALAKFLGDAEPEVAQAAARALGKIATPAAVKSIQTALPATSAANQLAFCEGLFRCAETASAKGQRKDAVAIYDALLKVQGPHQVRAGAVRGAILARGKDGNALLKQYLGSDDYIAFAAAVRASMEMSGADTTKILTTALPQLAPDNQVVVLQALGLRKDATALPAISASAKSGPKAARLAAIKAIPMIGQASAAPVLVELLGDSEREIAQAAQESLAAMPGKPVDDLVIAMLASADSTQKITGIDLIARRRMLSALPALQQAATGTDAKVRPAAIRRFGEMASLEQLPMLLDLLLKSKGQDLESAEQAVSAVCAKAGNPESSADQIAALMSQAQPAAKGALLGVLSTLGGAKALLAVRTAASDSNAEVRAAAIRALGSWKTAEAAPDLLAAAQKTTDEKEKMVCLRSYFELATQAEQPADQRLAMVQKATPLIQSAAEKKLFLGTLGNVGNPGTIAIVMPYVDDAAAKEEACAAVVSIADKALKNRRNAERVAPRLIEPLKKAAQATANADLAKRANALLEQAQKAAEARP